LIEIGLDVLNPIQPASMDPAQIKRDYGGHLCFWGTIDEQRTLPFGKPSDVEAEVRHRLRTVGKDGGLILSPTHHVQLDTPFPAMSDVGRLYEGGEYFVPEMLISARAMRAGLEIIKPLLVGSDLKPAGTVAVGTVMGDLHDIGKNLVGMMLEGAGFAIRDLGTDVSPEKFIDAITTNEVDLIGLSALLTTTMPMMETTINAITRAGLRNQVKIIIGGAPITQAYADKIGADGFAPDASQAVKLAVNLVNQR
jgi:5-methyltetrahydrofolate--homocysteine methyltransferase